MNPILANYDDRKEVLAEFERRKRARAIAVTVDDGEIKKQLRKLDQPICLFGEGPADRRERLRNLLAELGEEAIEDVIKDESSFMEESESEGQNRDPNVTWYHEGPPQLRTARLWIAEYSLPRARDRIATIKQRCNESKAVMNSEKQELLNTLRKSEIVYSQIGDNRPISSCTFSPNNELIATSSWSGLCKLWSVESLNTLCSYRAHNSLVGSIAFNPHSTIGLSEDAANLVSCGTDGSVFLWNLHSDDPIGEIKGHKPYRVSNAKFHPSGRFLATCCFDNSWRLFDLEHSQEEEILFQEGHSKPVYDMDFHPDGSLAATGGLDSFGRVWDLRTGRCIMFMEGHLKGILSINFSPNGYHIATGSEDHSIKIWNLRERKLEYTIAAHSNIVSKVKFEKQNSHFLISSSYDQTIKLWSSPNWTPIQTLKGHENKIMGVDVTSDSKYLASSSYDRTFKIWSSDSII